MEKSYDLRGRQSGIMRVARFSPLAFIHMLFYRILIFVAFLTAVTLAFYVVTHSASASMLAKILLLITWILFTPQLFSAFKALSLVSTKGRVFGHLNEAFVRARVKGHLLDPAFEALPYAVLTVWVLGFVLLFIAWFS